MAIWKKLSPNGGPQPKTVLAKDSNGDTTEVKQVKLSDGTVLWGKYSVASFQGLDEFIDRCCPDFKLYFVNPTYGEKEGEYVVYDMNDSPRLYSFRPITPGGTENIGYHGEEIGCEYSLYDHCYANILPGGTWQSSYKSGQLRSGNLGTSVDGYHTLTGDLDLDPSEVDNGSFDSDLVFFKNAGIKWAYLADQDILGNVSLEQVPTTRGFNVTRVDSPLAYASSGKLYRGDKIYYGDTIEVNYFSGQLLLPPQTGYLSGENSTVILTLRGLTKNGDMPQGFGDAPAYLYRAYQNISLPTELKNAAPILSWSMTRTGSGTQGYLYTGTITKNALTAGEDIPLCLSTSSNTNNANWALSGTYDKVTNKSHSATKYWSGSWSELTPFMQGTNVSIGNPFVLRGTGFSLQTDTIEVHRPANYLYYTTNASGQQVATTRPSLAYSANLGFLYGGNFYTQTMDSLGNVGSILEAYPTVTLNKGPVVVLNDKTGYQDGFIIIFGQFTIKTTATCRFKGSYKADYYLDIKHSMGAQLTTIKKTFTGTFNNSALGITFGNSGAVEILDNSAIDAHEGKFNYRVEYELEIGGQKWTGSYEKADFAIDSAQSEA